MSARIVIDALDFVRCTKSLHGKIIIDECMRLKDFLANSQGKIEYKISGTQDKNRKPMLQVIINGEIHLFCQRCLDELVYVLDINSTLHLAKNETELSHLDETEQAEGILVNSDIDITKLVEDEIILSLPISPRHRENECSTRKLIKNHPVKKKSPFAALVKLKKLH